MKQIKALIAGISRTLLGMVFVFSGAVKAIDPLGTVYKIEDYLKAFGGFFIDFLPLAEIAAWSLIILELLLGICMLLNVRTNWTSWISFLFYCVMTPLTLYIALTNPVSDCGCFGDAVVLTNWQTFWKWCTHWRFPWVAAGKNYWKFMRRSMRLGAALRKRSC